MGIGKPERGVRGWAVASTAIGLLLSLPFAAPLMLAQEGSVYGQANFGAAAIMIIVAILVTATLTAIPAFLLVSIVRQTEWRRGYTDAIVSGGVTLLASALAIAAESTDSPGPAALVLGALGALGGLVYWLAAGRPQPPY